MVQGSGFLTMRDVPQELPCSTTAARDVEPLLQSTKSWDVGEIEGTVPSHETTTPLTGRFEYSIVYHPAYEVPALYFNGYTQGMTLPPIKSQCCSALRLVCFVQRPDLHIGVEQACETLAVRRELQGAHG